MPINVRFGAFPRGEEEIGGLNVMEYFAAAALSGLLANPELIRDVAANGNQDAIIDTAWMLAKAMCEKAPY